MLKLVNIRSQTGLAEAVKAARVLSRFQYKDLSPAAVAGLALVALLPRVKGQPDHEGFNDGIDWFNFFWGR